MFSMNTRMMKRISIRVDLDSLLLNPNDAIREGNSKRTQTNMFLQPTSETWINPQFLQLKL